MGDPQEHRLQQSSLFTLNKRTKKRIVPQEAKSLRCMVRINLVKINTLKVKWNHYYLRIEYTNKTLEQNFTVLLLSRIRVEKTPPPSMS